MKPLNGKKEICRHTGRSWKLIRKWVDKDDFPADILGGRWESYEELIDEWKMRKITHKSLSSK